MKTENVLHIYFNTNLSEIILSDIISKLDLKYCNDSILSALISEWPYYDFNDLPENAVSIFDDIIVKVVSFKISTGEIEEPFDNVVSGIKSDLSIILDAIKTEIVNPKYVALYLSYLRKDVDFTIFAGNMIQINYLSDIIRPNTQISFTDEFLSGIETICKKIFDIEKLDWNNTKNIFWF